MAGNFIVNLFRYLPPGLVGFQIQLSKFNFLSQFDYQKYKQSMALQSQH